MHIGIVAVSSPGAALCYETICVEGERFSGVRYGHPEVSIHSYPLSEYMKYIWSGDWKGVARLLASSANKLADLGADFVICPDNTVHIAFEEAVRLSRIPWLHIAEEVAREALRRGFRRLLIMGTKVLMESDVYPSRLSRHGIEYVIPDDGERVVIDRIIFDELVYGVVRDESREKLAEIINRYAGVCDAVVLGCTELPLIIDEGASPIPTLDSTRILARAALRKAYNVVDD